LPLLVFCTVPVSWIGPILEMQLLQGKQLFQYISTLNRLTDSVGRMVVDLDLIGARYNIITLIFFIPYVLCQPPATVLIRKIGPRIFLAAITVFWGATMIVSHLIPNSSKTTNKISGLRLR
jgi:hypothetical protein